MFLTIHPTDELRAQLRANQTDEKELDATINKCVQVILQLGQKNALIKKPELNKAAFPRHMSNRLNWPLVQASNIKLHKTFGLRLYEINDKALILVNSHSHISSFTQHSDSDCEEKAVLYFLLIEIFVSPDQKITLEDIEKSLSPLKMSKDRLGNIISGLVKKMYISVRQDQDIKFYCWHHRAYAEVDPDTFFNSFLELVGEPESGWVEIKRRIQILKDMPNR